MPPIYTWWLEQTEADVPLEESWLSPPEAERLLQFRILKRRCDWRLGRWTAKRAVAVYFGMRQDAQSLAFIEIRPAPSGAPKVYIKDALARVSVSLSHRGGVAMCAVAAADTELGCDLETVEPRSEAFVCDYFTEEEQKAVANCDNEEERNLLVALIWSAKECALKALATGLRADTRSLSVAIGKQARAGDWHQLSVCANTGRTFQGWWRRSGQLVRTLVGAPASLPVALRGAYQPAAQNVPRSNLI